MTVIKYIISISDIGSITTEANPIVREGLLSRFDTIEKIDNIQLSLSIGRNEEIYRTTTTNKIKSKEVKNFKERFKSENKYIDFYELVNTKPILH